MSRARVIFSGIVQGVGFRYTATLYARALCLKGWVRNLPDGRVQTEIEGPREDILRFMEQLKNHFSVNIAGCEVDWLPEQDGFTDFEIIS
jgi:acylphosphatase